MSTSRPSTGTKRPPPETNLQSRRTRKGFDLSQLDIHPPRQPNNDPATTEIVVSLHPWGNASFVFQPLMREANWRKRENTLWQARVTHNAHPGFGYMLMQNAAAALRDHPNPAFRTVKSHETETNIRILNGAPPVTEDPDPDGIGFLPWQPVLYGTGESPAQILSFIHFLARHRWTQSPPLIARIKAWPWQRPPPMPWRLRLKPNMNVIPCFSAVPPATRRHVLCQVEYIRAPTTHAITFYGHLYPYLSLFDKAETPAGSIPATDATRKPMYVRHLQLNADKAGKDRMLNVLENVLCRLPIYLIDCTEREQDEMAAWLASQENVILAETYM